MATRYKTYEMPWGFATIDSKTETAPPGAISGPYDVNLEEAEQIQNGAKIEVDPDQEIITVTVPEEPV